MAYAVDAIPSVSCLCYADLDNDWCGKLINIYLFK